MLPKVLQPWAWGDEILEEILKVSRIQEGTRHVNRSEKIPVKVYHLPLTMCDQ
jgi:hypothetical protein